LILTPCIIDYVEINQINAVNYTRVLLYFSFTMARTCFGKTMSDLSTTILTLKLLRKEHSRSLRMALFYRNM
jgi:hypothetical protein